MSLQFLRSDAKGVIGYIGTMRNSGTQVVLYVNLLDRYGQVIGKQKVHVALFNDAERSLLKNNARVGDMLFIDGATISTPPARKQGDDHEGYVAHLKCSWYNQVTVVAGDNHLKLAERQLSFTA